MICFSARKSTIGHRLLAARAERFDQDALRAVVEIGVDQAAVGRAALRPQERRHPHAPAGVDRPDDLGVPVRELVERRLVGVGGEVAEQREAVDTAVPVRLLK